MPHTSDLIELTLHRALCGELEPAIVAIDVQLREAELVVHVYRAAGLRDDLFAETVEGELDQRLPEGLSWREFPPTRFEFHDAAELTTSSASGKRIYMNYWAEACPKMS
jgi:hypothetical protein